MASREDGSATVTSSARTSRGAELLKDVNGRTMKRQRMDRLIQMSLEFAGVHEHDATGHNFLVNEQLRDEDHRQDASRNDKNDNANPQALINVKLARRRTWTAAEDAKLVDLVQRLGRDWAAIACEFSKRDRKRCRDRFINHLDPALKQVPWSQAEDGHLLQLQREIGSRWAQVATKLHGRSPDDAKNRWLRLTSDADTGNKQVRAPPQRWTVAESDALESLVDANGAKDWFFIVSQIPGRTDLQCSQHWHRVLAPRIIKGRATWTRDEDKLLQAKVDELGPQWEKIAGLLPGRIGKQCRERYLNQLDATINTEPWTEAEESLLADACEQTPRAWARIAELLPGRTQTAIKNHWNSMRRRSSGEENNNG